MKEILIVFFLFVAYLNAARINRCSGFSLQKELETINNTCITMDDKRIMTGNIVTGLLTITLYPNVAAMVQETIGLSEMRKALGFKKMGPWSKYYEPSEKEIKNAQGIEEYYELKEPRNMMRSANNPMLFEKNVVPNIGSFDERLPSIRTIYRCEFAKIRKRVRKINRKTVDKMIEKWTEISTNITVSVKIIFNDSCMRAMLQKNLSIKPAKEEEQLAK